MSQAPSTLLRDVGFIRGADMPFQDVMERNLSFTRLRMAGGWLVTYILRKGF